MSAASMDTPSMLAGAILDQFEIDLSYVVPKSVQRELYQHLKCSIDLMSLYFGIPYHYIKVTLLQSHGWEHVVSINMC